VDSTSACYSGSPATRGVGACKDGTQLCTRRGEVLVFGACTAEKLPSVEICGSGRDHDCDGLIDCKDPDCASDPSCRPGACNNPADLKACPCGQQNASRPCYDGPAGTRGIGVCKDGMQLCLSSGEVLKWGGCTGATVPGSEACQDGLDNDCDGLVDCKDPDCSTASGCVPECATGATDPCYTGPPGTMDHGLCKPGKKTCSPDGKWGPCLGEVKPGKSESYFNFDTSCRDGIDNDCNGLKDCSEPLCGLDPSCAPPVCSANQTRPCYSGPPGTENVGPCRGGTQTCAPDGKSFGACKGDVVPRSEGALCADGIDNDCNGQLDCKDAACVLAANCCVPATPGTPADTTIWAHSSDTLYQVDPKTFALTTVGNFNAGDSMTDLAVTPNGELYTISFTALYRVSKTSGKATYIANLTGATNNGLTFLTNGTLLAAEGGGTGNVIRIDPTTGALTSVGSFGNGLSSSGDLVAVNTVMYGISATLPGGADASADNVLMRVDVATGKATVVGAIGFGDVWGLAYASKKVIAFTKSGQIIEVDPLTGKGTLLATKNIEFWGAGMSPKVPVNVCP
jgi:hypothetical protein